MSARKEGDAKHMELPITGGLVGWKRIDAAHGCVLVLQIAAERSQFYDGKAQQVSVVLNDRQLRSFTRDLQRAATKRNLQLWAKPNLLRRLLRLTPKLPQ